MGSKKAYSVARNNENISELLEDKEKLIALIDRAQDGDKTALPTLRRVLDEEPRIARIVDFARDVERSIARRMSGDDLFTQEAIPRNLESMRRDIAGENPSPLERLLTERIALCWLELQYFEVVYSQSIGQLTIPQGDHHQRRIDKAHRRYLSSIKTLAQIRKMGPMLQINIAEKQINQTT